MADIKEFKFEEEKYGEIKEYMSRKCSAKYHVGSYENYFTKKGVVMVNFQKKRNNFHRP